MKQKFTGTGLRSYFVFTSKVLRLILFVLVPIFGVGTQLIASYTGLPFYAGTILATGNLLVAEIILDNWVFGAIVVKDGDQLDYLQSSPRGRKLVRDSLRTSMLRQSATFFAVLVLGQLLALCLERNLGKLSVPVCPEDWAVILVEIACGYFLVVCALLVTRHFDSYYVNLTAAMIAFSLFMVLVMPAFFVRNHRYAMLAVFLVLDIAASVFSQWVIMRRIEESYYDKRS